MKRRLALHRRCDFGDSTGETQLGCLGRKGRKTIVRAVNAG